MKLIQSERDTVPTRLTYADTLFELLIHFMDLALAKSMLEKFTAQTRNIGRMIGELDLDEPDAITVATRLKEVLDNYLEPLGKAIEEVENGKAPLKCLATSHFVANAEAELRCLYFTMELTDMSAPTIDGAA